VNAPCNKPTRKPDAGHPHVRFDEGEGSFGPSLLYICGNDLGVSPKREPDPSANILFHHSDREICWILEDEHEQEHEHDFSTSAFRFSPYGTRLDSPRTIVRKVRLIRGAVIFLDFGRLCCQ
jgi:hypothetical protein